MTTTPNMSLVLPTEGGSADIWDTILDTAFGLIDAHDHTTGKGVQVPAAGINWNADLSASSGGNYFALKDAKAIDFQPRTAASVAGYSSVIYVDSSDGELHWIDASARNAKLTLAGAVNVSLVGGIGGDYSAAGALFSYDDSTKRYLAQQEGSPRPWAGMAIGALDIYQQAASIVNRVRQQSPSSLAASYAMTWFTALPGSQVLAQIDNTGAWFASNTVPNAVTFAAITATTITASTDIKFSFTKTLIIPPSAAQADSSGLTTFVPSGGRITVGTDIDGVTYPVMLSAGDEILSWTLYLQKTSASGTITAELLKWAGGSNTGTPTVIGSAQTNNANNPGFITLGQSSLTETISAGNYYGVWVHGGGTTGDFFFSVEVGYNRP